MPVDPLDQGARAAMGARAPIRRLRYPILAIGTAGLCLAALQLLVGRQLGQQQGAQLANGVTANLLLGQAALERFTPQGLADLSGMRLAVGRMPPGSTAWADADRQDPNLGGQAARLRSALCRRLSPCPVLLPAAGGGRGIWVEMPSALESVWLFVSLPSALPWPPDPWLLSLSLGIGSLTAGLLFQLVEVQRPLRQLEQALTRVGREPPGAPVPLRGTTAVRRLTERFNRMVEDLSRQDQERATMLAGIAHDLRSPLTRLRLRLQGGAGPTNGPGEPSAGLRRTPSGANADGSATPQSQAGGERGGDGVGGGPSPQPGAGASADLDALERITAQFLLFAGADRQEAPLELPLEELLGQTAAGVVGAQPLELDLEPLQRRVRPTSLSRAVANLLENALEHGRPPLRLVLRATARDGFEIQVWDAGPGISREDWPRALTPFLRLDDARGGGGHSGLGLAIAQRIAREHRGDLERLESPQGFGVVLRGHSLPSAPPTSHIWTQMR